MTKKLLFLSLSLLYFVNASAQQSKVTLAGIIQLKNLEPVSYVNLVLKTSKTRKFVAGTVSNEKGKFVIENVVPGEYLLQLSFVGMKNVEKEIFVGALSNFLDIGKIEMEEDQQVLQEIKVIAQKDEIDTKLDKKTFKAEDIKSQVGASVLQVMQTIPGLSVQDGKLSIRGSSQVAVLVNGQQTALTGFNGQSSLDNIPASAIEKIEVINNPSAKYDANGNAGIVNIIFKKINTNGLSGKLQMVGGAGALAEKMTNLPSIRPQFKGTLKLNPSFSISNKTDKTQAYLQADFFDNPTLNKNEFIERYYSNGDVVRQQIKRNRRTSIGTVIGGIDWKINDQNLFSHSVLFSSEKILDDGDEPFFNGDLSFRRRLWQFLEDEVKTTVTATNTYKHYFSTPGQFLNATFNYTWHQEDEKYFFTDLTKSYLDKNDFKLLSDENVFDGNLDFQKPLKWGKIEAGLKMRYRFIPTNMIFHPGQYSPFDVAAGGWANYKETIPATYFNYFIDNKQFDLESGLRMEYVNVKYEIDPNNVAYKSNGYSYFQPFPNFKLGYKLENGDKLQFNLGRRVDRPAELDIRVFPKYDDAEIVKVGNPALKPQFTNSLELGYKKSLSDGYFYAALYQRVTDGTITRIAVSDPEKQIVYNIMQNAGLSSIRGLELFFSQSLNTYFRYNVNVNFYQNTIDQFTVNYVYPKSGTITSPRQQMGSSTVKLNAFYRQGLWDIQMSANYLAPDLIPQGRIEEQIGVDFGLSKKTKNGKHEFFFNATDLFNTMVISKTIQSQDFKYTSRDYYETQVLRIGVSRKI